jgi:hypothetical protein
MQAGGLRACLSILEAQLQRLQGGGSLLEAVTVNTLQTITNAGEYPACDVELRRSAQLEVVRGLASQQAASSLVQAAAQQALRMAGVKENDTVGAP